MANNQLSINKIVSIFRDLAVRSEMVNDFGYGPTYNIESRSEPLRFSYLWLDDIGSVIESTDAGYKSIYYTFDLYCMDKINKGDSNYQETISDTNTILNQIIAEMAQHKYYRDMGLNLNGNITMEPVTEATNDNVNGWKATMTLKMPYRLVPCNIPIEPITGYTVSLNSNITEYRLVGATGPQGATGPAGEPGATGATGAGANITADNGLIKTGDNIQLGGALTENTSITGNLWQLYFNPKTITIDTAAGDLNLYANTGDVNMSSTGDTSIGADGSLYFTTYTGASLYADAGDVNINVNNGNFNVNAIAGTVNSDICNIYGNTNLNLSGASIAITGLSDLLLLTPNKSIRLYETPIAVSNNGSNNGLIVYDDVTNKGLVYFADYSTNFTPESLVTKRFVTNYVATASSTTIPTIAEVLDAGDTLDVGQLIQGNDTSTYVTLDNGFYTEYSSGPNSGSIFLERTIDLVSSGTVSLDGIVVNVNNSKIVNLTTASNPLDAVNLGQLSNTQKVSFGFGADGSGGTLLVGTPTYLVMDHSGTITQWDIVGNTAGTAIFDIWKSTNQTLPTVANTIVASAKPTVGSASYATSIGLTGWGVTYSAGDIYGFNIDSIAAFTKVNLSLRANKS